MKQAVLFGVNTLFNFCAASRGNGSARIRENGLLLHAQLPTPRSRLSSESERLRDPVGQIILGRRDVDLDDAQFETLRLPAKAFGEHPIALEQVVQGPGRITGLPSDLPQRAPAVERSPAEAGRRQESDCMIGHTEERLYQAWQ